MNNTSKFITVQNFIGKHGRNGNFPVDTTDKLANGRMVLRDRTDFVTKEVPATHEGEIKLTDANGLQLTGKQSFKGRSLEKGENLIITHIALGYASNVASGKEALVGYTNDAASVPAGAQNATLIIRQNGDDVVKLPVSNFVSPAKDGRSPFIELSSFSLLKEDLPFDVIIDFPVGNALGADKHYFKVQAKGMGTFEA